MPFKKIAFFTAIIVSVVVINNLVHSIYTLWQKQHLVVKEQQELDTVKKENQNLKKKADCCK